MVRADRQARATDQSTLPDQRQQLLPFTAGTWEVRTRTGLSNAIGPNARSEYCPTSLADHTSRQRPSAPSRYLRGLDFAFELIALAGDAVEVIISKLARGKTTRFAGSFLT